MDEKKEEKPSPQIIYAVPQVVAPVDSDEIELRELWYTLMRRKFVVLTVTLLVLLASVVYIFTTSPVYEARALLKIGVHDTNQFFESANSLKAFISFKYDISGDYRNSQSTSRISSVSIPDKNVSYVSLTANGPEKSEVENKLNEALEDIKARHYEFYDSYLTLSTYKVGQLGQELDNFRNNVLPRLYDNLRLLENLQELRLEQDLSAETALSVEMGYLMNDVITRKSLEIEKLESITIPQLEKEKMALEQKLEEPFLVKTKIVGNVYVSKGPVKPNKKMILAVALVAGLMLGVFLVFFLEFIKLKNVDESDNE